MSANFFLTLVYTGIIILLYKDLFKEVLYRNGKERQFVNKQ